jgi:CHAT domain-containing protein
MGKFINNSVKRLFFLFGFLIIAVSMLAQSRASAAVVEQKLTEWRLMLASNGVDLSAIISNCTDVLKENLPDSTRSNVLTLKATAFRRMAQPVEAMQLYQKVLALRRLSYGAESNEVANSFINIGNCWTDLGRIAEAEKMYRSALKIKEKRFPNQAHTEKITVYNALGRALQALKRTDEAAVFLKKSVVDAEKMYGKSHAKLITPLRALADFYFKTNDNTQAIIYFKRAANIQLTTDNNRETTDLAEIINDLANVYLKNGEVNAAIEKASAAKKIYDNAPQKPTPQYGNTIYTLAKSYLELGDLDYAFQLFQTATHYFPKESIDAADVQTSLAKCAWLKGNVAGALNDFAAAITLYENTYTPIISDERLATAYLNLGDIYLVEKKRYTAADYYFSKALTLFQAQKQTENVANCLLKMGQSRRGAGQAAAAQQLYTQSERAAKTAKSTIGEFNALFFMGELADDAQKWTEALILYERAQQILEKRDPSVFPPKTPQNTSNFDYEHLQITEAITFTLRSKARKTNNSLDWETALQEAKKGIAALSNLKLKFKEKSSEVVVQHLFFRLFDSAVEACLALNEPRQAFQFSEQSKQSLLKRLMVQGRKLSLNNNNSEALQHELAFSTDSIQRILTKNQTLVEYHLAADRLFIFVLKANTSQAANNFQSFTLPVTADLPQKISQFYELCSANPAYLPDAKKDAAAELFVQLGKELYAQLIFPIEKELTESLIIVPDGLLCYVPFEALIVGNGQSTKGFQFKSHDYFLNHHLISYEYSSTFLALLRTAKMGQATKKLLAFAPEFDPLVCFVPRNDMNSFLKPLEHNGEEATAICKAMNGDGVIGCAATRKKLLATAANYSVLHFSTHGILDNARSENSYLAFSNALTDSISEATTLTATEIFDLKLNADMVVLSACQTAIGSLYRGEGIMSLARSFRYAGARTIVASLWNVDDAQTPTLMQFFYENLNQGATKAAALTLAKRQYLSITAHDKAHPFYWAGFMMIGDEGELKTVSHGIWWVIGGILGGLVVGYFVLRGYRNATFRSRIREVNK